MDNQPDLFTSAALARQSDPETSHRAARSLDLKLKPKHVAALRVIATRQRAEDLTDDGLSEIIVDFGIAQRHEQARRIVRTLRENYGFLQISQQESGLPVVATNSSGRLAQVNELTAAGHNFLNEIKESS